MRQSNEKSYLFKAIWVGTSISFRVSASSEEQAKKRAEKQLMKMEGGPTCLELNLIPDPVKCSS